jgi:dephospho-CoA kinase
VSTPATPIESVISEEDDDDYYQMRRAAQFSSTSKVSFADDIIGEDDMPQSTPSTASRSIQVYLQIHHYRL